MAEKAVTLTKNFKPPVHPGRHFRLICLTGPNKGTIYYLHASRIIMGRSEEADIKVLDPKSSRQHVEIVRLDDSCVLTDLGSQNGVVVNDLKVTQYELRDNDKIIIGQTVYKYSIVDVADELKEKAKEDEAELEENNDQDGGKKKKNKILYLVIIALLAFFFLGDDQPEVQTEKKKEERKIDTEDTFSKHLRRQEQIKDQELEDKLSAIIHRGRRELREGNYYRAINEFNMALVLSPKHGYASFYLQKAQQKLDEEIEAHFLKAAREVAALKYDAAVVSYCSVVRLLGKNITDKRLQDAQDRIHELEEKMGMNKGEIKCIEE